MPKPMHLKSRKRQYPTGMLFGLLIILILVWAVSNFKIGVISSYDFDLKGIDCVGPDALAKDLKAQGQYFWQIDFNTIRQKTLTKYFCIREISFDYVFPSQLRVQTQSRIPLAQIAYNQDSKLNLSSVEASSSTSSAVKNFAKLPAPSKPTFVVDQQGVIFETTSDNSLPIIFVSDAQLNLGYKIDEDKLSKISQTFDYLNNKLADLVTFTGDTRQFKLSNYDLVIISQPGVIVSLKKDVPGQLASLQLILNAAKINQRPIKYVDLRFNKPIVVYDSPIKNQK